LFQFTLQPGKIEETAAGLEIDEKIDIAARVGFASRHGAWRQFGCPSGDALTRH